MLDYKDYFIINLILQSIQSLSVEDLIKMVGVSRRSIYYSLNKINDYLRDNQLDEIENHRDLGLFLDSKAKQFLKDNLYDSIKDTYIFTQKERVALILVLLIIESREFGINAFENLFNVSRNTIINDLKELRNMIAPLGIKLEYTHSSGYEIQGDSLKIRSLMLYVISSQSYLFKIQRFDLFDDFSYEQVIEGINQIEKQLQVEYVYHTKDVLAKVIAAIIKHKIPSIEIANQDLEKIINSREYVAVKNVFHETINPSEIIYLTLQLMGLRIHSHQDFNYPNDEFINEIVRYVIDAFKMTIPLTKEDEDNLTRGLYIHFKSGIVRYQYGIIYDNKLKDEVQENYQALYNIAKIVCLSLEKKLGYPIPDDDVAYIALHFGAYLNLKEKPIRAVKVLLVCLNGIATSKILRREIEDLAESIEIIDAISLDYLEEHAKDVDYIISTVDINKPELESKIIRVSPILSNIERRALITLFQSQYTRDSTREKHFFSLIEKNFDSNTVEKIIDTYQKVFHTSNLKNNLKESSKMLKEVLTAEHIKFANEVADYKEAIQLSAESLINKNIIEQRYVNKVIENIHEMGPYIVVAPDIAISHARPTDGANDLGMSILYLQKGVPFGDNKDKIARIVITLAAPDETSHLKALGQLSEMLMNSMDEFLKASNKEDLLNLIDKYSQ